MFFSPLVPQEHTRYYKRVTGMCGAMSKRVAWPAGTYRRRSFYWALLQYGLNDGMTAWV